jgi:hypothetical protein
LGLNPLRSILSELVDFDLLATSPIKLFVTATNVHSGRGRIFCSGEITPDVLLACAQQSTRAPMLRFYQLSPWQAWSASVLWRLQCCSSSFSCGEYSRHYPPLRALNTMARAE